MGALDHDNLGGVGLLVRLGQGLDLAPQPIAKVIDWFTTTDRGATIIDSHTAIVRVALPSRRTAVPRTNAVLSPVDDPREGVVLDAVLPAADGPRPGDVGHGHDAVVVVLIAGAHEVYLGLQGRTAPGGVDEGEALGVGEAQVLEDLDAGLGDEALAFGEVRTGIGLQMPDDVQVGVFQGSVVDFGDLVVIFCLWFDGSRVVGGQEAGLAGGSDGRQGEESGDEFHCESWLGYFRKRCRNYVVICF
mmetsp:Transcript_17034/g.48926  ORF Transcript_17034/g.48926 Transcript_17034/m.48926 type:complete len:246 (-) Transcript_17034:118-855(-)